MPLSGAAEGPEGQEGHPGSISAAEMPCLRVQESGFSVGALLCNLACAPSPATLAVLVVSSGLLVHEHILLVERLRTKDSDSVLHRELGSVSHGSDVESCLQVRREI